MQELIPSEYVRNYIKKRGKHFTDFEKATIIYNMPEPYEKRFQMLRELAENTGDMILKQQIIERLVYGEEEMQEIQDEDLEIARFENAYVVIPNPFHTDDIVRVIPDGALARVCTSWQTSVEWYEKLKKYNCAAYEDADIVVEILNTEKLTLRRVNPIYLEKC